MSLIHFLCVCLYLCSKICEYVGVCLCLPCKTTIRALTHTHAHTDTKMVTSRWAGFFRTYKRTSPGPFPEGLCCGFFYTYSSFQRARAKDRMNRSLKTGFEHLYGEDSGKIRCHNAPKHHCGDNCWMEAPLDHGKTLSMQVIQLSR